MFRVPLMLLAAAMLTLGTACADVLVGGSAPADRASIFDDVWENVDLHYSFLEYKHVDWAAVGARYRPLAALAVDDHEFARVLADMLRELHDVHVALTPFGDGSSMRYISRFDTTATHFDPLATASRYVASARPTAGGHIVFGMAATDVGYIRIASFAGADWASEIDAALAGLTGARQIIIDLRSNGGGTRALALDIAGRFADRKATFGFLRLRNGPSHGDFTDFIPESVSPAGPSQFTGSVVLLTNRRVVSAAEEFVLAMRARGGTTVVGDTTGGASGGPIVRELSNGWTYELSEWIEYTPDRRIFEGIGLAPDVVVAPAAAKSALPYQDMVLENALARATSAH